MMMRRSVFEEADGFDEKLAVEFNDVDLCLRLRRRGYLIVYTPHALLYHYESASRGRGHQPADKELFVRRWGKYIKDGDPYYNPNLTLESENWEVGI